MTTKDDVGNQAQEPERRICIARVHFKILGRQVLPSQPIPM
jgi:hypothetical protein